ncbi:hypothetical protein [Celeribacter ethanolicus]|uniref:hypothetical protein n=1 Tax=Celeribacter ethanolicus TaxID=1758178 RepID=UPI0012FDF889|nr:hypothetical protein [Celeribacter ethanolicus]
MKVVVEFSPEALFTKDMEAQAFPPSVEALVASTRADFLNLKESNPKAYFDLEQKIISTGGLKAEYEPCGTCQHGGGVVNYYDGSGGRIPDRSTCLACP